MTGGWGKGCSGPPLAKRKAWGARGERGRPVLMVGKGEARPPGDDGAARLRTVCMLWEGPRLPFIGGEVPREDATSIRMDENGQCSVATREGRGDVLVGGYEDDPG